MSHFVKSKKKVQNVDLFTQAMGKFGFSKNNSNIIPGYQGQTMKVGHAFTKGKLGVGLEAEENDVYAPVADWWVLNRAEQFKQSHNAQGEIFGAYADLVIDDYAQQLQMQGYQVTEVQNSERQRELVAVKY